MLALLTALVFASFSAAESCDEVYGNFSEVAASNSTRDWLDSISDRVDSIPQPLRWLWRREIKRALRPMSDEIADWQVADRIRALQRVDRRLKMFEKIFRGKTFEKKELERIWAEESLVRHGFLVEIRNRGLELNEEEMSILKKTLSRLSRSRALRFLFSLRELPSREMDLLSDRALLTLLLEGFEKAKPMIEQELAGSNRRFQEWEKWGRFAYKSFFTGLSLHSAWKGYETFQEERKKDAKKKFFEQLDEIEKQLEQQSKELDELLEESE